MQIFKLVLIAQVWRSVFKLGLVSLFVFLSGACAIQRMPTPNDPYYAPVHVTKEGVNSNSNGSLFREAQNMDLFSDNKASRIGDIITVVLSETTKSQKSTNVEVTKESEVSSPAPSILGTTPTIGGRPLSGAFNSERDFKGEADADQSNSLSGTIAVSVVDVWPNGTLVIRGEKWMTLNRGDEFIRISGLVRPDDVSPDNTVRSTKIANARISYAGTGALADSQKMGVLSRFFNSQYWPF